MKRYRLLKFVFIGLLITFMFGSCTEKFEEVNTDPRVLSELDPASMGNLFGFAQYYALNVKRPQLPEVLFADHFSQYYANIAAYFRQDMYHFDGGWGDICWKEFYGRGGPGHLADLIEMTDPVENPGYEAMHAVAQVFSVVMYERISSYFGPVPVSEAGNAKSSVMYDDVETIYKNFFTTLDDALATLSNYAGGNAFGTNDQIFAGDINNWILFANTLRLRIAMRISDVEPALAQTEAEQAVADGVMTANDHNAVFHTTENSWNGIHRIIPWNEFRMSATMESVMKGYNDPRIDQFWTPAVADGEIRGLRNGYTPVELSRPELTIDTLSILGPRWAYDNRNDNPKDVMTCPEAYFLRAEGAMKGWNMGGTAEEFYNTGIAMNMEFWGITDAEVIAAYQQSTDVPVATHDSPEPVSDIPVLFNTGDNAIALEQIATQKWLALFPNGVEAWADIRRSELPKMYPRMNTENPDIAVDEMPRRIPFSPYEYDVNAPAIEDALAKLGGPDKANVRLWWDPQ
ncbi:MAG: SusD/RagB family nutrient-binding outer membrane lipoprotein [Bacteroidota bacterium]